MKILAVLAVFLPLVFCAPDPKTVCLPDQVSFQSYDLVFDIGANISIDFTLNRLASVAENRSVVQDLANAKAYETDASGACVSYDISPAELVQQCLPADAIYLGSYVIGNAANAETWEFSVSGSRVRYSLTQATSGPRYPVLAQIKIPSANIVDVSIFVNPVSSVADSSVFTLPSVCPPRTVV